MRGLVPRIYVCFAGDDVDSRDKTGHDGDAGSRARTDEGSHMRSVGHRSGRNGKIRLRQISIFISRLKLIWPVQSLGQKYSSFVFSEFMVE